MAKNQESANVSETSATDNRNFKIFYRRTHPGNRCSYGIPGNKGLVVFELSLFKDGIAPPELTLSTEMAEPKAKAVVDRAQMSFEKAKERADKAQARLAEQQKKAEERKQAAEDRLAKAQAQILAAREKAAAAQVK